MKRMRPLPRHRRQPPLQVDMARRSPPLWIEPRVPQKHRGPLSPVQILPNSMTFRIKRILSSFPLRKSIDDLAQPLPTSSAERGCQKAPDKRQRKPTDALPQEDDQEINVGRAGRFRGKELYISPDERTRVIQRAPPI
eukprot:3938518-Pyramimonas_sp.AAC.1